MLSQDFSFSAGTETLRATQDIPHQSILPDALSLHGAGPSNRVRAAYIGAMLAHNGHGLLRFDFSGHGESTGTMADSSLAKRLKETDAALAFVANNRPRLLIGTSMGGHLALRKAKELQPDLLVLFCPAVYATEAESVPFGQGFTEIIRRPESFKNSMALEDIQQFRGKILLFMGDKDDIIPPEVPLLIQEAASNASSFTTYMLEGCPHPIHAWAEKHPDVQTSILKNIQSHL